MVKRNYRRLRWRLIWAIIGFSMIPLMGLGFVLFDKFDSAYEEKAEQNLRTIVDNKQRAIDLFLKEKVSFLKTLAYSYTFEEINDDQAIAGLFRNIESSSNDFVDIGVIDSRGMHVAYRGPYSVADVDYSEERWFFEVMLRGVYVSDVFMGFRNFPHFIIAVQRKEGDKFWILRATVNLEVFNSLVQTVQIGKRGDAYLVNKDNILQTPSRFRTPVLTESRMPEMPTRFTGVAVEKRMIDSEPRLLGMTWLSTVDWLLVISEDPREEMSPMIKAEFNAFLVFLAGTIIVCIGAVFVTNRMVLKIMAADKEAAALDASLLQSNKMAALGKMAAGIAHEVNNPLTLIRESAGWVKDLVAEEDPAAIKNYDEINQTLDKIDRHVERAKSVTHRMLGFGRRMEPRQEGVNVNTIVNETLKFLESEALYRNIEIDKNFDPNIPLITNDPIQMQQVFLNVIDNAIDAIDHDGTITLRSGVTNEGNEVFVSISDTGKGIPPDQLEKVFDPFYTTKKVGEGTGLGLSIVFGILERLGGRIFAESKVGEGSTFTITFPFG
ncbi:two-component sensor histidine kinase [Oceanidesulfovibrio indonesiensis]|uniref:histidine kinase n=1 Tax=Oceanidesulfovibrio indonesiensis TaxID=54767 RepID=A0A7M3MAZ4_9BACT|nr:PAS domain-containing sensor histidine kinase [Oceanidesulfovibrio indonesiensis]TVM14611.1 two-component sensor histidine kinase [Oceanidesulfovibrio indonesiensis]